MRIKLIERSTTDYSRLHSTNLGLLEYTGNLFYANSAEFETKETLVCHLLSPLLDHLYLPHYKSPTALLDNYASPCGISSLLHSVNLILFTLLLVHLILRISPHHTHSHLLSVPVLLKVTNFSTFYEVQVTGQKVTLLQSRLKATPKIVT